MKPLILVADDDAHIRDVVRYALEQAGMAVLEAADGAQALARAGERSPKLIVLDVGMPEMDGLEVCREIRKTSATPILFLSARDEEIDRILGLEMGGDDYVTKPFSPRELVARVKSILKRSGAREPQEDPGGVLARNALELNADSHRAHFAGKLLDLTALEFSILRTFLRQPNRAFSREQIMHAAYAANIHVSDRTIDSHIRNIRAKLSAAGCADAIETVHGVGFRLGGCEV